jgi:hypothetical protein
MAEPILAVRAPYWEPSILDEKPGGAAGPAAGLLSAGSVLIAAAGEVTLRELPTSAADTDSTRDRIGCSWNISLKKRVQAQRLSPA